MRPGSLAKYREREWVVLPSTDPSVTLLRPIGGSVREVCGVYKPLGNLMRSSLAFEAVTDATFPLPENKAIQDHAAVGLMLDASRLLLRDGAAPFRSLGHLSVRPRPYQFVPLLMALRLDTVRLLIADDVGVGKTVEGSLIGRELLDRGEIRRVAVVCPPYLCDQWRKELAEKFHIDATVIRSGTVSRLERLAPPDTSIFQHNTHFVASIDLVKGGRYREGFLQHCPEFVLIDEAHGAAQPPGEKRSHSQQQRHDLLCDLAKDTSRHLVLLTATPHSGMEDSFLSLLGLLRPEFRDYSLAKLAEPERVELAKHFVQRRRPDVKHWMGEDTPFPEREPWPSPSGESTYVFSKGYHEFYQDVYQFATDLVRSAETLSGWKARMRFWSALALLRCVTSSPAAAETSLLKRVAGGADSAVTAETLDAATEEELEETYEPMLYDPIEAEAVVDAQPANVFDAQDQDPGWPDGERKRLRDFAKRAAELRGKQDTKLQTITDAVRACLKDGFHPIVWCRYIATSDYVAEELQKTLQKEFKGLKVTSVTGATVEDERRLKVDELGTAEKRVLVATDCLSEGINLQDKFNAIIHYDLPWNPNRLEQREGRVDRFGQTSKTVRTTLIYGQNNPIDGAVLDVLIRKAHQIRRDTGVSVPVPTDSETVMEAVLKSVFAQSYGKTGQKTLFDETPELALQVRTQVHASWDRAAEEEKESRSRFAQRSIKPEEVQRELEETDGILGDPEAVHRFLQESSQRVPFEFRGRRNGVWEIGLNGLPDAIKQRLDGLPDPLLITFDSPVPEGVVFVGRSHPLVEGLAEHLVDHAFYPPDGPPPAAARCGAIRTDAVTRRTTLLLLRLRFLVYERGGDTPTLAEETLVWGYQGLVPDITPLPMDEARRLMDEAQPSGNLDELHRKELVAEATAAWDALRPHLEAMADDRKTRLEDAHHRIRSLTGRGKLRIEPQMPPDLLGVLVLMPVPKGVQP